MHVEAPNSEHSEKILSQLRYSRLSDFIAENNEASLFYYYLLLLFHFLFFLSSFFSTGNINFLLLLGWMPS